MCQKFSIFQLLLKIQKLYLLITFNRGIVLNFFQHIWNQCEILRFWVPILTYLKKKVFSSIFLHIMQSFTLWVCLGGGDTVHTEGRRRAWTTVLTVFHAQWHTPWPKD